MKPEKTILPGFLIADMYRNSIVITEDTAEVTDKAAAFAPPPAATAAVVKETPDRQWYLGSNLQKIVLLVSQQEAAFLDESSLQFLTTILGACKLNLGDVAIVNLQRSPFNYQELKQQLSPKVMILFGVPAQQLQLPFTVPQYQVQPYDQCQLLMAPALSHMLGESQQAKLEKSKLWLCLKKIFNL